MNSQPHIRNDNSSWGEKKTIPALDEFDKHVVLPM